MSPKKPQIDKGSGQSLRSSFLAQITLRCSLSESRQAVPIPHLVGSLSKRDVERQHYNLKENSLAILLMHALGIGADSKDGMLLSNWRSTTNFAAGDFSGLAMQVVSRRQSSIAATLSVANVNTLLDSLAKSNKRKVRVELVQEIVRKATILEFKWFMRILFKDLKIGLGENTILDVLHDDARAMMATCVDLKRVCSKLHNRDSHPFRKELTLGKVLKCQHSKRMNSIEAAWLAMKRSEVVAECKFDGDRMQIHRDGPKIWFWSRNGKEHPEYTVALQDALYCCLSSERCILDGELLVWDVEDSGFKARTKALNHDAARAARKGLNTSHRVCYVVFDILYEGNHGSLMHVPLKKRREVLRQVLHHQRSPQIFSTVAEGSEWAIVPSSLEELNLFFWKMVEKGNEGIVLKRLDSQWAPDNRDGRWSKIKPDYVFMGSDLDLLIIGGYYGSGSRGGKIASFLLALVDQCTNATRFVSICRCGQGLSEDEFSLLESKLSPYFIQNTKGGRPPPTCGYLVTNSRYECPDVWISRPEISIVLQICSEKRIYPTQSFKAGWTFRFPRIVKVRYDKCWKEALGVQGLHFQVAVENNRDIICLSWVSECFNAKARLPLCPRHYLFQSSTTRSNLQTAIDMYGDPWFRDVDTLDLQKILTGINGKESSFTEQELRQKLKERKLTKDWFWDLFKGCSFYFHKPLHSVNPDSQTLANMTLDRLRLAAEMLGASTSCDIMLNTTHVIVYVPLESTIPLRRLLRSLKQSKKVLSESPHINIVRHSWLEDCLRRKERLCVKSHSLREGVHVSTESESLKQQCTKANSSGSSDMNSLSSTRSQSLSVLELDDDESTTNSTHPVREKQSWAAEENLDNDDGRKRHCKGILKSPNCLSGVLPWRCPQIVQICEKV
ncbi:hypothetical protein GOP47_0023030 [Adiantum capillus-veneris]|uniref:DNA ligase n=1 Tax=Adiantum capillus-veneris TaxID=13818 RepID=A0A9D4U8V1_ADICA|nr:hypothetical protein GOP47_0023030 [Adiantum capillus-veneris]